MSRNAVVCGNAQQLVVVQPLRQRTTLATLPKAFGDECVYAEDGEVDWEFIAAFYPAPQISMPAKSPLRQLPSTGV